jgi:hypothetical protein
MFFLKVQDYKSISTNWNISKNSYRIQPAGFQINQLPQTFHLQVRENCRIGIFLEGLEQDGDSLLDYDSLQEIRKSIHRTKKYH